MNPLAHISTAALALNLMLPGATFADSIPSRLTSPLTADSPSLSAEAGAELGTPELQPRTDTNPSFTSTEGKETAEPTSVPTPESYRGSPCSATGYEVYGSGLISQSIPDGNPGGVLIGPFATNPNCRPIGDVIVSIQMEHTWIGDLRIDILYDEDNNGSYETFAPLLCRPGVDDCSESTGVFGCDGDLAGVYGFSDTATETLGEILFGTCFETHPSGCYLPEPIFANSLADLEGFAMGGSFYLYAIDYVGGDLGTIEEVTVFVQPDDTRDVPSEFATVQAAVDAACPGDRIVIAPGTYDEVVTVLDKSLVIEGDPQDRPHITRIEFEASDGEFPNNALSALSVGTISGGSLNGPSISVSQCEIGTLSGMFDSIVGGYSSITLFEAGVFFCSIEDCQIQSVLSPNIEIFGAQRSTFSNGIQIDQVEDCSIANCDIANNLFIGEVLAPRDALFSPPRATGIDLRSSHRDDAEVANATVAIAGAASRDSRVGSIIVTGSDVGGSVIFNNGDEETRFTDCEVLGSIESTANRIVLTNTTCGGNCTLTGGDLVQVEGSRLGEMVNVAADEILLVTDSWAPRGIVATAGSGAGFDGNVLGGLDLIVSSNEAELIRNTFYASPGALGTGVAITTPGDVILERNIVDGFGTGIDLDFTGNLLAICNCVWNNSVDWIGTPDPTGTDGNIQANPLFCVPEVDFSLESTSPCLPGNHPDGFGCGGAIGAFETDCAASDAPETIPSTPRAGISAHPNPSSGSMTLSWQLPESGRLLREATEVQIFTVDGRAVWSRDVSASTGSVTWDLRNEQGVRVSPGVYFARVGNGEMAESVRVMVVR
ncbi:MAG: hypothetical protein KDA27_05305 [Candidatus Eisenbacteria bacterium]|uniref:DUF1565 domain-containing protein n=1 Tax=Eiseniibacteriota bacterium TaxID=2212470 RepID=A0A956N9S9_UNCEI|nr:hypothetical protein [Candidatus Eisenbacteria bacterium]